MEKRHCLGCYNDFYNDKNDLGVKQCWSFEKKKKLVWRIPVGLWESPPYKNKKKVRIPPCYRGRGSNRTVYIKPEVLDSKGYWK